MEEEGGRQGREGNGGGGSGKGKGESVMSWKISKIN